MKNRTGNLLAFFITTCALAPTASPQIASGGGYNLDQSVIASGGSSNSGGGIFSLDGTIGQPAAGTKSANSQFDLISGFWSESAVAPTAALVSIKGRVRMENGTGIRNVIITLNESDGSIKTALSSSFGNYEFTDVEVGQIVIVTATAKKFVLSQPTHILNLSEDAGDVDFIVSNQ